MKTARYFYCNKDLNTIEVEKQFESEKTDKECLSILENECRSKSDFYCLRMGYVLK